MDENTLKAVIDAISLEYRKRLKRISEIQSAMSFIQEDLRNKKEVLSYAEYMQLEDRLKFYEIELSKLQTENDGVSFAREAVFELMKNE
jgi:hypothetical protein